MIAWIPFKLEKCPKEKQQIKYSSWAFLILNLAIYLSIYLSKTKIFFLFILKSI